MSVRPSMGPSVGRDRAARVISSPLTRLSTVCSGRQVQRSSFALSICLPLVQTSMMRFAGGPSSLLFVGASKVTQKPGLESFGGVRGRFGRSSGAHRRDRVPTSASATIMAGGKLELADGTAVPVPGFGTGTAWYSPGGNDPSRPRNGELVSLIKAALQVGYRHLDAAEMYGTELEVGLAIKESGVPRESIFLTTKVWPHIKDPLSALSESLKRLQVDYVDLYLIHAPFFSKDSHGIDLKEAWQALETAHDRGLAKNIGVSNFRVVDLEQLLPSSRIKPAANQIEFHPYLQSPELVSFCHKHGIAVQAYSPLAPIVLKPGGPVDSVVEEIANKYKKSPGQVLLRWTIQEGVIPVTTSGKESRQKEQLSIDSFVLTEEEVKRIREAGNALHFRKYWAQKFDED